MFLLKFQFTFFVLFLFLYFFKGNHSNVFPKKNLRLIKFWLSSFGKTEFCQDDLLKTAEYTKFYVSCKDCNSVGSCNGFIFPILCRLIQSLPKNSVSLAMSTKMKLNMSVLFSFCLDKMIVI